VKRLNPMVVRVGVSMAIAVGLVLVVLGVNSAVTGKDAQKLPDQIESILPVRSAIQVQSQEPVVVDLAEGFTGELRLNGVAIETVSLANATAGSFDPGKQVTLPKATIFEPGNDTLTFSPTEGAPVEAYNSGVNTVTLTYWKIIDGPKAARTFTWQFDVV
jgi:hypothetical protein